MVLGREGGQLIPTSKRHNNPGTFHERHHCSRWDRRCRGIDPYTTTTTVGITGITNGTRYIVVLC